MKKQYILISLISLLFSIFIMEQSFAQGIYQMWSTTVKGGPDDKGVLFSTKYDGTGYTAQKKFSVSKSGNPATFNKPLVYNNKFYNIVGGYGGLNSNGTIGSFDPATDFYTELADLFTIGASISNGAFVLYNSKMYGTSFAGGANDKGTIYEFNPANNVLTKLYDFDPLTGHSPVSGLVVSNNKLYGTTSAGGATEDGVIFSFDPATNIYTDLVDFNNATSGTGGHGSLTDYAGKLWGTTSSGGLNDKGALFSYDPATNIFVKKKDFSSINSKYQSGKLSVLNGKLYGTSSQGGTNNRGVIYQYDPVGNVLAAKYNFAQEDCRNNMEFTVVNNILYGSGGSGGAYGDGGIISFDPTTNIFTNLVDLIGDLGASPTGSMTYYDERLYGFNTSGGYYKQGTLFTYGPVENGYASLVLFGGKELQKPSGPINYYNNTIYGTTWDGGNKSRGGVFNFDRESEIFDIKLHYTQPTIATNPYAGGFVELNNKFYGIASLAGPAFSGIYEFDPATNTYLLLHSFTAATGTSPYAVLTVYNGKLYGTCTYGANLGDGNIFEFDPAANTYTIKTNFNSATTGKTPTGRLLVYGGKMYGTCTYGGANGKGTFYEFDPANNNLVNHFNFLAAEGTYPEGGITASNGKLYGVTKTGGTNNMGVIFEFDPLSNLLVVKEYLSATTGGNPTSSLTLLNNKLYTITNSGGANNLGTLLQFDPVTGNAVKKNDMTVLNGNGVKSHELLAIPALTAPGTRSSCTLSETVNIDAAHANEWIAFTDEEGRAVAEINANGNILGNTSVRFYINSDNVRLNADGQFYLDRNITITPTTQPITPVTVRLYIRKTEFDALKATAGAGINNPNELKICQNNDDCADIMTAALQVPTVKSNWATDYVYAADVNRLSSFYFAKVNRLLPIKLISFSGNREALVNHLTWKATCTNNVNFTIERSQDGINFIAIGAVDATQLDCNMPFSYNDKAPLQGKGFYRLCLKENNGPVTYSQIIMLDRDAQGSTNLQVFPNPVVSSAATAQINAMANTTALITVTDMSGRKVIAKNIVVTKGINSIKLNTENLASGIYVLLYNDGRIKETVRFLKN